MPSPLVKLETGKGIRAGGGNHCLWPVPPAIPPESLFPSPIAFKKIGQVFDGNSEKN
jgi:hypothetical protein